MHDRDWTRLDRHRASPPAWLLSVAIHAALVLAIGFTLRMVAPGAAEQPVRTVGIVLKHSAEDGTTYAGEDDRADATLAAEAVSRATADATLAALPEQQSVPDPTAALPGKVDVIGPGAIGMSGAGIGSDPTRGGGGQPRGTPGGKARVGVFGVVGEGRKFIYVFDRSTSMAEGGRLAAAKAELIRSLDALQSTHQFQIIFFHHRQRVFDLAGAQRRIPFATERMKRMAAAFVASITAAGSTNRFDALRLAVAMRPDVVFFLTDDDNPMSAGELDLIRTRNRGVSSINTIEFGYGPAPGGENFLLRLARQNGGKYVYINASNLLGNGSR